MAEIIKLNPWKAYETNFCGYVTDSKGNVTNIFLKPDGQEIKCEHLKVIVHENGLEFVQ